MEQGIVRNYNADPPGRVDSTSACDEPERRVHASNGHASDTIIKEYEIELQNRREAIMALRDVVLKQREAIRSLKLERQTTSETAYPLQEIREETISGTSTLSGSDSSSTDVYDESESTGPSETNSPSVSFDPSFRNVSVETGEEISAITCEDESSIDSSDFLKMEYEMQAVMEAAKAQASTPVDKVISFEAFSENVHSSSDAANGRIEDVIESIQEQASHVDAAIALGKLETAKNELQSLTSDLYSRNAEVAELKNRVKLLEDQVATVELERDLHMAEASRAREDLKDCLRYVVKLKKQNGEEDTCSRRSSTVTEPASNIRRIATEPTTDGFVTPEKSNARAITLFPAQLDTGMNEMQETPVTQTTEATSQSTRFPDDQSICTSFSSDGYSRRNLALCFWTQRGRETGGKGPSFERIENDVGPKRTSLFRKRQRNQKKKTRGHPSPEAPDSKSRSSQRGRADKLNQSLAEASREASELRTRLHSITKYYDNIVISVQQNAGSNNTEYEADMINQLSFLDREKRAVSTELRQKDNLMALYQRKLSLLEEDSEYPRNGDSKQQAVLV